MVKIADINVYQERQDYFIHRSYVELLSRQMQFSQ
jgi:hypothetical protein